MSGVLKRIVGNGGTVMLPLQNKQTMESIEEEDETQINATTTINQPAGNGKSPKDIGGIHHHMQGPYGDSFYNKSPIKLVN